MIEMMRPLARLIEGFSINGLEIAATAASSTRFAPEDLASAHHGLALLTHDRENVGEIEIDQAFLDDEVADAGHAPIEHLIGQHEGIGDGGLLVSATQNRFWFGIARSVSAALSSSAMPASAKRMRRWPSKANGLVTTPMVRMPSSRAVLAITGAARCQSRRPCRR